MSGQGATGQAADAEYPPLWRNRDFRRFFVGRFVTNVGDSFYSVATLWLVFELSGSTSLTGVTNSLLLLPFLLQIVAGPVVDRYPVRPVLVGSQVVQGVVVLVLPVAVYTGNVTVELVLVTVPVLSLATTTVAPAQATIVPRLVAEDQLSRSNSALTTITYGLDMVFDALGGALVAVSGVTALFLLDSLTFAVAGLLFVGMAVPTVEGGSESEASAVARYVTDLREGAGILRGTVFVEMLFASAVFNFALGVALAVLPAFGALRGGPASYGLLLGALGLGRLAGSTVASSLTGVAYGRLKSTTYLVSALLWVGSVLAPTLALAVSLFGLAWVSAGVDAVLVRTLNQRVFPADVLGRVSAIKGTASTATLPVGSLVGGLAAEFLGPTLTMGLAASGFGFAGLYFALRPRLRGLPAIDDVSPTDLDVRVDASPAGTASGEK